MKTERGREEVGTDKEGGSRKGEGGGWKGREEGNQWWACVCGWTYGRNFCPVERTISKNQKRCTFKYTNSFCGFEKPGSIRALLTGKQMGILGYRLSIASIRRLVTV